MQYFKSLDFNRQFTQFKQNKRKYTMKRFYPFLHFPFSPEIHVYSSNFFMLIHGNSNIFILFFGLFTQKVMHYNYCSVTCFFS